MQNNKNGFLIFISICLGVFIFCMCYVVYNNFVQKEDITTTITDKWFDPNHGAYSFKVELEDHRIFSVTGFDYSHLQLNKPYTLKVYKQYVEITGERWRI
jgi:hypothetical protein